MRSNRMLEIIVGLFVLVGVAAVLLLTTQVSNFSNYDSDKGYTIHGYFENIGGLKVRSAVTMSGVRIGRVSAITLDKDQYEARVDMVISNQYIDLIPLDSGASILTAGLLGEQYIGIDAGGDTEMLTDGNQLALTQSALVLEKLIGTFVEQLSKD